MKTPDTDRSRLSLRSVVIVQALFLAAFAVAWLMMSPLEERRLAAQVQRGRLRPAIQFTNRKPAVVSPLYDDETVVSDEELTLVLQKIVPRFQQKRLKPNFVEHALRAWGSEVEFRDSELISGPQLADYLLNAGEHAASWGPDSTPILVPADRGVSIRWGGDYSASVHHDHLLASLAEAGVDLDEPVFTTNRRATMQDIFSEALRDFRLDERETEWSTIGFALYLAPQRTNSWHNSQGRHITFDLLAARLMRCHRNKGVCLGTHRVYSLMALLRLNQDYGNSLISDHTIAAVMKFLEETRDLMIASQDEDGSWPPNWHEGEHASDNVDPEEQLHRRVIATGHHLEWLAIAPKSLHPPHDSIVRAAGWIIRNVRKTPQDVVDSKYTFYSHVGNALALWRKTTPAGFWKDQVEQ